MTTDQLIWLITFIIVSIGIFFTSFMEPHISRIVKTFEHKSVWILLAISMLFVVSAFFINNSSYQKAIGLSIIALITAFFSEIGMMFAPFFMTLCFAMAFPQIFN